MPGPSSDLFRGPVLSGPSTDLFRGPVLSGPGSDPVVQGAVGDASLSAPTQEELPIIGRPGSSEPCGLGVTEQGAKVCSVCTGAAAAAAVATAMAAVAAFNVWGVQAGALSAAAQEADIKEMEEEESCTCGCIAELQEAVLEQLHWDFRGGGVVGSAPMRCQPAQGGVRFCANPPLGCLPCAAPCGSFAIGLGGSALPPPPPTEDSVGSTVGWGYTPPPFPCPAHAHTLPPDLGVKGQGMGW